MAKLIAGLLVSVTLWVLPSPATGQRWYDTYDFASVGVAGYWPLNGDATDVTGNGHHGAPTGDVNFSAGRFGMAATFDGMGDYILLSGHVSYQDEFSTCGWILRSGLAENFYSYIFIKTVDVNEGYQSLGYYQDAATSFLHVDVSDFATPWYLRHFVSIGEGAWHHLCAIAKPGDVRIFLDGTMVAQAALAGTLDHGNFTGNYIGGFPQILFGPYSHNGMVDEVVVFHRVLSPEEVQALGTDANGDEIADLWVDPCSYGPLDQPLQFAIQPRVPHPSEITWESCGGSGLLKLANSGVAFAVVRINGEIVVGPGNFGPGVVTLEAPVILNEGQNQLLIEMRGKPGANLSIEFTSD